MIIPTASEIATTGSIPTGLPQLDKVLGIGGIPFRRITEISGEWSVGKTTLALAIVRSAQEQGIKCIWVDAEWAWDNEYAKKLGVDTAKLGMLQTRVAEDSLDKLLEYVENGKDTLIVIDAVGALHPKDEAEKDSGSRTIGAQSALMARFCRKVVPLLSMNNNALIVLNHEYTPLEPNMGRAPSIKTSGGKKLEYHKSVWLRLSKSGIHLKQGDLPDGTPRYVGFKVKAEIRKNKLADTQKRFCELEMYYGKGFSGTSDLVNDAKERLFTKQGQFYYLGEEKIARGEKGLRERFADPEFTDRIKSELS